MRRQSFWTTLPGIITAVSGLIGAVAGLIVAVDALLDLGPVNVIDGDGPTPTPVVEATPTPAATPQAPTVPDLLTPIDNTSIKQNDPDIGCPPDLTRGFGYRIPFDWTDSFSSADIAGYEIVVEKESTQFPLVDEFVTDSELTFSRCNVFITDQNLDGWQWRVRAKDKLENFSEWTPFGKFRFGQCRISLLLPCSAPPGP
ncbi:MAG: hypothetical protein ACE5I2_15015 [Anaerolineae bacterium]